MDFERLFRRYGVECTTKKNRGWVNIDCPYCDTHRKAFNLGFNPNGDYCTCWKCGYHSLKGTLSAVLGIKISEVEDIVCDYETDISPLSHNKTNADTLKFTFDGFTERERMYLEGRGFNADFLQSKYGVNGGGLVGRWSFRIIVPLIYQNRIVSWTGRSILSKDRIKELEIPRYKNLSEGESIVSSKDILYNLDHCNGDTVVITEGAFDVMKLGDDFACSFGITITERQIELIASRYRTVYMMFDNEVEAQNKARKYGMMLKSLGCDVTVVDAYSDFGKKDGGELDEWEVNEIRNELGLH